MRFLIETGSESHTTSSASLQAKYHGGEYDGRNLYEVKGNVVSTDWHKRDKHSSWVTTVYELPEGQEVEIIGRGRTGNRGADRHNTHAIYRLDPAAEVMDSVIDTGLRDCDIKGRLTLIKDVLAAKSDAVKASQQEGF